MRHLTLLAFAALALAGCNGGEDFSDATVPGCPLGAPCSPNLRGEVLVEFVGPQIDNLGYICGSSVGYTDSEESTTVEGTTVPPYAAVCPASASRIEFYLGSALFEGYKVSLGYFLFPRKLAKDSYQITAADLVTPPSRVEQTDPNALHRVALLNAVSTGSNDVRVIDEAIHTQIDTNELIQAEMPDDPSNPNASFDYPDYNSFFAAWDSALTALDAHADMEGQGNTGDYDTQLATAANLSRAGIYVFETSLACALPGFSCGEESEDYANLAFGISALVLPDGSMLGGGWAEYAESSSAPELDFLTYGKSAALDQRLTLGAPSVGVTLHGLNSVSDMPTNATLEGRFLLQTLYNNETFLEEVGSDFELDYPSSDYEIGPDELGYLNNTVLGYNAEDFPYLATKTSAMQVARDSSLLNAANGTYIVRLYRACVGENDDEDEVDGEAVCRTIDDAEIGNASAFNYPTHVCTARDSQNNCITPHEVSRERLRNDALDGTGVDEFCIEIDGGKIVVGADGACPVDAAKSFTVGMVTRTFADDASLRSVNVAMRLAPGFENFEETPHYNAEIQGRLDLRTGEEAVDDCRRLFRLGDDGFLDGIRAAWLEVDYLPRKKVHENSEAVNPTDADFYLQTALTSGAVEFYEKGSSCDPNA